MVVVPGVVQWLLETLVSRVVSSPSERDLTCGRKDLGRSYPAIYHPALQMDSGVVEDVLKVFLVKYGQQWDGRGTLNRTGKAPIEAAASIIEDYGLPCTTEEFMTDIAPFFSDCWSKMVALPGADRLIKHLHNHGVPIALASNSPKPSIETKLSYHHGWKGKFSVIIGGDEVREGKPSPEIFLEAAKKLNADPSSYLVVEDSL
ncbi:Bifunctional riboflavin kinase/FMN phosphatase [Nymphaea thermarum]|nr:Bifunctional riboflavin kinase/FMN phosphatase [Nymphaea thermarum]